MFKKLVPALAFVGAAIVAAAPASAAIDVTTAITGISDAQTAVLSIIGALLALSVAIFGVAKVYSFVSKKAGA